MWAGCCVILRSLFWILASCLAACSHAPELERRELPVPAVWPLGAQADAQASKAHWKEFFPDPQLQRLIAAALENNRDLRIAAARVQEARALYGIARADLVPTVALAGSGAFSATPSDLVTPGAASTSQRYDLGLSMLSYEVDFWGRLSGLSESARFSFLATEESRRSVQLGLVADVAGAYFAYLQAVEACEFAQSTIDLRERTLDLIGKGRALGGTYDLEYEAAAGLLESAKSNWEGAEHQKNQAANRLNFLVGNALPAVLDGASLGEQRLGVELAPGLPSEVLLLRPDVMAAEQRLRAAHANIAAARAAFMPRVLLTVTAGLASQGLASLFNGTSWVFQPTLSLPLFDGGRLDSGVDLAEARKVIAVADYEKTIQQAFREVADLLSARKAFSRQLGAAQANRRSQARLLEIANARYTVGLVSYLEVLEAQRDFIATAQTISQLRRAQLDAATQLYKALGGGAQG